MNYEQALDAAQRLNAAIDNVEQVQKTLFAQVAPVFPAQTMKAARLATNGLERLRLLRLELFRSMKAEDAEKIAPRLRLE